MSVVEGVSSLQAVRELRAAITQLIGSYGSINLIDRSRLVVAFLDRDGRVLNATAGAPLANLAEIASRCAERFGAVEEGDAVILSDPYSGGLSVSDHFVVVPVPLGGGLACVGAPFFDVGGKRLGNQVPEAPDLFVEGVRTTPIRVRREGRIDADVLELLKLNSRAPVLLEADVLALVEVATRFAERAALLGAEAFEPLLARSRAAVASLRERASWPASATGTLARRPDFELSVRIDGSGPLLEVGVEGPAAQDSSWNTTASGARSAALSALGGHLGLEALNSGVADEASIELAPGALSASLPAAVGGGYEIRARIGALVGECLAAADGAPAAAAEEMEP